MKKPTTPPTKPQPSLRIRSDLRAGAYRCSSCEGKVMGNQLFKPTCTYCEKA